MFKNKSKIIAFFLVLFMLLSSTIVLAENEISNDVAPISETTQTQQETYKQSDVYLSGENITIDYIVDGNAFIMADSVTIKSQIGGDAFIIAKKIVVEENGYVFNNLFAISDFIEIKGVVYDIYSISKTLTFSSGFVYRDIKTICTDLNINASVGRNIFANCENINFNTVEGSNAVVKGNLTYIAPSKVQLPENIVNGEVSYTPSSNETNLSVGEIVSDYILDLGTFLAFVLIIWLLCLWLLPNFLKNTNQYVGKSTLTVLGSGLLTLIAIPVICIGLLLLQLTSTFSLLLLALYILALVISTSLFTITANNYLCSKLKITKTIGTLGILILSSIVVWAIQLIPYVGSVLSFIIVVLGLGVLIKSIIPKRNKKDEIIEE